MRNIYLGIFLLLIFAGCSAQDSNQAPIPQQEMMVYCYDNNSEVYTYQDYIHQTTDATTFIYDGNYFYFKQEDEWGRNEPSQNEINKTLEQINPNKLQTTMSCSQIPLDNSLFQEPELS